MCTVGWRGVARVLTARGRRRPAFGVTLSEYSQSAKFWSVQAGLEVLRCDTNYENAF